MEEEQLKVLKDIAPSKWKSNPTGFFTLVARDALDGLDFWKLHENTGRKFYAFNKQTGQKLTFAKRLTSDPLQHVYLVLDDQKTRWVLKWDASSFIPDENAEVAAYNRLKAMGGQCPRRLNGFQVLWFEVLVLEFLDPLDRNDDVINLVVQLMTTQLRYLHRFGCYGDLKPDNIRKRVERDKTLYFLIDMDLTTERLGPYGYRRKLWTPRYTSVIIPPYIESAGTMTYKDDLLELIFVGHTLLCQRAFESQTDSFHPDKIQETKHALGLQPDDYLADPQRMFDNPIYQTQRGYLATQKLLHYGLRSHSFWFSAILVPEWLPMEYDEDKYVAMAEELERDGREFYQNQREMEDVAFKGCNMSRTCPWDKSVCTICSAITATKCGYCYRITTPLCENAQCRIAHDCK